MNNKNREWDWKTGGIALGILSIIAIYLVKPLGVSTQYVVSLGMLIKGFAPDFIEETAYLAKYAEKMSIGYGWILVIGMAIGAYISVVTGGPRVEKDEKSVPDMWGKAFGYKPQKRYLHAFIGGFLILFGARLAGGCTSGHVISGITQLSISGFIFAAAVFLAGIPTAKLLYSSVKGGN